MKCLFCEAEFTPTRKAKFCSKKCAIYYKRKIKEVNPSLPNLTVTDLETVTDNVTDNVTDLKTVVDNEPDNEKPVNVHAYNNGQPIPKIMVKAKKNNSTKICPKHKVYYMSCGCTPV